MFFTVGLQIDLVGKKQKEEGTNRSLCNDAIETVVFVTRRVGAILG